MSDAEWLALEPSPLVQRLDRRRTEPIGIIDVRHPQAHCARIAGWIAERFDLKGRPMIFRFTTTHTENVATEVQQLMAELKVPIEHFRVSMAGSNSIVELESVLSHKQQEKIVTQLNRQGVITEVTRGEDRRE